MPTSSLHPTRPDTYRSADRLEIAGWTASAADYWPDRTVLTVAMQGCPWDCANCPSPELRDLMASGSVTWRQVREVLVHSRGQLDGVVFAGGEPTWQDGLADAIIQVRELGMAVALHTAGAYPQRLAEVLPLVDRVVLEIRAPATLYREATRSGASAHKAFASLRTVLDSGVELQVRTCVDPAVLTPDDVVRLRDELAGLGVREHVVLQLAAPTVR
ncbi:MAG TPA: anaerobic ribonucleoside-triphosphate reductase activating protein [Actinotalea sp.]|nr:anaerobic ribonucleoside-triphosphate reductase activating protein [Actinotalea sp.]